MTLPMTQTIRGTTSAVHVPRPRSPPPREDPFSSPVRPDMSGGGCCTGWYTRDCRFGASPVGRRSSPSAPPATSRSSRETCSSSHRSPRLLRACRSPTTWCIRWMPRQFEELDRRAASNFARRRQGRGTSHRLSKRPRIRRGPVCPPGQPARGRRHPASLRGRDD